MDVPYVAYVPKISFPPSWWPCHWAITFTSMPFSMQPVMNIPWGLRAAIPLTKTYQSELYDGRYTAVQVVRVAPKIDACKHLILSIITAVFPPGIEPGSKV